MNISLEEILIDHQMFHSTFQQDHFITGKGGTIYGAYKQCLRELSSRVRSIQTALLSIERVKIDLGTLDADSKYFEVDQKEKELGLSIEYKSLEGARLEFIRFYQQAVYLKGLIGELTDSRRDILEAEMWEYKTKEMIVVDLVSCSRIRSNTYEMLLSLPKDIRLRILISMKDPQKLISWYEDKKEILIPNNLPEIQFDWLELE